MPTRRTFFIGSVTLAVLLCSFAVAYAVDSGSGAALDFPPQLDSYGDAGRPVL